MFLRCKKLRIVEVQENSELQIICKKAFESSLMESFCVPKHVKRIDFRAFAQCTQLQIVEFGDQSEIEWIDDLMFYKLTKTIIMVSVELENRIDI